MRQVLTILGAVLLLAGSAQAQTRPVHSTARASTKAPVKRLPATAPKAAAKPTKPAAKPAPAPVAVQAAPAPVMVAPAARPSAAVPALAGSSLFRAGSNTLNLGIGFGLDYGSLGNATASPALSISYLRGVANAGPGTISVGGLVGYQSFSWQDGSDKATLRHLYAGARGAYHYNFGSHKLDAYAGLGLGVRVVSYSYSYVTDGATRGRQAELSGFVGARYFFSDKVGAFSELGYDMSYLKVGLSARF